MSERKNKNTTKQLVITTILLVIIAALGVTAVSLAWFTINDITRINSMVMNITSGLNFKIDLLPHTSYEDYKHTLTFPEIREKVREEKGYDMAVTPLVPVTTLDYRNFTLEHGEPVSVRSGYYVEYTLHFKTDCESGLWVHLTERNSKNQSDGTYLWSDEHPELANAMRIAFDTPDGIVVYNPGASERFRELTDDSRMFWLPYDTDIPVLVRIWLEGTDDACNNSLKGLNYNLRLRFEGTDETNQPIS